MSGKGDINAQIAVFMAKLKRREIAGAKEVALATATLLVRFISARKWTTADDMVSQVRELGHTLTAAQPHEYTCGNIVRRVLKSIRTVDEAVDLTSPEDAEPASAMFGLLSAPNQEATSDTARARDQKSAVIDDIHILIDEISNDDPLYKTGMDMINDDDVLLFPCPGSATVLEFLIKTAQKRTFSVIVTESYPNRSAESRSAVELLTKAGVPSTLIPDASVYAIMDKVSKVIISSRTVLANGGCLAAAGVALACRAAKEFKKPVLAMAGSFKLSPLYPFDIDSLIEVGNSGKVIDFADGVLMDRLEVMNPTSDYIAPELLDIIITTDGSYSPNFVYRIVLDNYSAQDQEL